MPEGNTPSAAGLSAAARKHLLLVACTVDRINLASTWRRPVASARTATSVMQSPWAQMALNVAGTFLPRKLRFLVSILRALRK